ncbi:MAG: esterase family protein [Oscillospiraceae bacterium]|nr:esterase family protein [Oscillospiraceae bacterium]
MALFNGSVFSKVLPMETGLTVILPGDRLFGTAHKPSKVLYLLHGLTDNNAAWSRYTSIDRYIREHNVAVIMPEGHHSFYLDEKLGVKFYTYITKELPSLVADMFAVSSKPEDTYIAGLSMGGYGALRCMLMNPQGYNGCGAFSAMVDMEAYASETAHDPFTSRIAQTLFGKTGEIPEDASLFKLAEKNVREGNKLPEIYITCGKQDFLYKQNLKFNDHLNALGIDHTFEAWDGTHEWGFWDRSVKNMIDRFFVEKKN